MTTKELTTLYREIIQREGYVAPPKKSDTRDFPASVEDTRQHLLWMLDEMDKMYLITAIGVAPRTEESSREKWHAWRGFVQGVLWLMEWRTIDEMRDDARGITYV